MRHDRPHVVWVLRHEGEGVDRSPTAGEQVDRPSTDRLDEPMQIVGVDVRRCPAGGIGFDAALAAARVVRHNCAVGEVLRQRTEAGGAHWEADQEQDRLAAGLVMPNVIRQGGVGGV